MLCGKFRLNCLKPQNSTLLRLSAHSLYSITAFTPPDTDQHARPNHHSGTGIYGTLYSNEWCFCQQYYLTGPEIYNIAFTRTDFGLASAWGVSMLVALAARPVCTLYPRNLSQS
jgi:hypothetical protein